MAEDKGRANPYRFGVLEGNHVEDRFSLDHVGKQVGEADQSRDMVPVSTMKDDFRWYNSALFAQKDALLELNPDLEPQVYNNKSLRPFLEKPSHLSNREKLIQQASFTNQQNRTLEPPESSAKTASLYVCCPQGSPRSPQRTTCFDTAPPRPPMETVSKMIRISNRRTKITMVS